MSSKTTSFSDGDGSITITTKNGATHIEAKDADGKLLYNWRRKPTTTGRNCRPRSWRSSERFEEMNIDIGIEGFEDKLLPPALELPELQPAKPKQPTGATRADLPIASGGAPPHGHVRQVSKNAAAHRRI